MNCELTNMVMIENPENGMVLVQKRVKYWTGVTFPGGHIEKGESFTDSAVREVKEETGLIIEDPILCDVYEWPWENNSRYLAFLYKTNKYKGEIKSSKEGEIFWIKKSEIKNYVLSTDFIEIYNRINRSNNI